MGDRLGTPDVVGCHQRDAKFPVLADGNLCFPPPPTVRDGFVSIQSYVRSSSKYPRTMLD